MSRKRFTEREVLETLYCCGVVIPCFRCRNPLRPPEKIEREHILEIALGGTDDPGNCAYSHKLCHDIVTNGTKATTAGSSKQRIAKVARILADKPSKRPMQNSGRKIPSRPFAKTGRPLG